jgi:hypothetical protein
MGTLSTITRYLKQVAGVLTEQAPIKNSAGAGDADAIPCLDATGRLDASFMPIGVSPDVKVIVASEALAAGNWVNIWSNAGVWNVRKADATTAGKECHGFVLAAVLISANATVYFEGINNQVSGMTPGNVFLHTTAGAGTNTCPVASGNIAQRLGVSLSATEVDFEPQPPITIA